MHTTIYKINDQDPLFNTRTLTPHPNITYMGKKTQYVLIEVKLILVEGKKKQTNTTHPQDCNSPINSSSNDDIKTEKAKKGMMTLFPSGHSDLGWCHIPGA